MDKPKKSLGQHWLDDVAALQAMLTAVDVSADDHVLEIGPGPGSLTRLLVKAAGEVTAVEFDGLLAESLPRRVSAANLNVVQQDILHYDLTTLSEGYKVVANIPYYLTSNLIRVLSESTNPPQAAALLVQKEVAQRAAAAPGDMSLLAVTAQYYWHVSLGQVVPAILFTPPPKVDSQILILQRRENLLGDIEAERDFFRLVKAGFSSRRKTLLNALSAGLRLDKPATTKLLEAAAIEPSRRAQTLSLDEWQALYQCWLSERSSDES